MRLTPVLEQIYPRAQPEHAVNPAAIFSLYQQSLDQIVADQASTDDPRLLELAWKLFDQESARRTSIDARAGGVLPATSIVASLIVGVGFGALKEIAEVNRVIIYATFIASLVFLGRSILYALSVQGSVVRYTLGPDDIAPAPPVPPVGPSRYERHIARKLIQYTINNYKINNMQMQYLRVAQQSLRNAIVTIIAGGLIVAAISLYLPLRHMGILPLVD